MDKPSKEQWGMWQKLIDGAADDCLEQHARSVKLAKEAMVNRVRADPRLREAMLEVLVTEACADRIRKRLQIMNASLWHQSEPFDLTMQGKRLQTAAATSRFYRMMDYSLIGGLALGDATRVQVIANSKFHERQATRMFQTSVWLDSIASGMDAMKTKQKVSEVFSEERLRQLQQQAINRFADATTE